MSLINFYNVLPKQETHNPGYERHRIELPFRALICCASGGGKTNLLTNLLYEMNNTFSKIYIVTKAPEPLYDHIINSLKNCSIYYIDQGYPDIETMPKKTNGLIVYDDLVLTKDDRIGQMFIRGRKLGYSSIYISQSFYGTPKIIRQNVGYVWLGHGMSRRDLRMVLSEFALGLNSAQLEQYYTQLTATKMQFVLIDLIGRNIRHNITEIVKEF